MVGGPSPAVGCRLSGSSGSDESEPEEDGPAGYPASTLFRGLGAVLTRLDGVNELAVEQADLRLNLEAVCALLAR